MQSEAMAAPAEALVPMAAAGAPSPFEEDEFVPIRFVYQYLHNAIKKELAMLAEALERLESRDDDPGGHALGELLEQYSFLQQIYKCHSRVEDEVRHNY